MVSCPARTKNLERYLILVQFVAQSFVVQCLGNRSERKWTIILLYCSNGKWWKIKFGYNHMGAYVTNTVASKISRGGEIYVIPRMGQNFDDYPDFQQKVGVCNNTYEKHYTFWVLQFTPPYQIKNRKIVDITFVNFFVRYRVIQKLRGRNFNKFLPQLTFIYPLSRDPLLVHVAIKSDPYPRIVLVHKIYRCCLILFLTIFQEIYISLIWQLWRIFFEAIMRN